MQFVKDKFKKIVYNLEKCCKSAFRVKIFTKNVSKSIDENVLVNYNEATKTYSHVFDRMLQKGNLRWYQ